MSELASMVVGPRRPAGVNGRSGVATEASALPGADPPSLSMEGVSPPFFFFFFSGTMIRVIDSDE